MSNRITILSLMLVACLLATSLAENKRHAATLPALAETPISQIVVPRINEKNRPLWAVTDFLRQETGVGIVLIDIPQGADGAISDASVTYASNGPLPLDKVLSDLSRQGKLFTWQVLSGSVIMRSPRLAEFKDSPLREQLTLGHIMGTAEQLTQRLATEVPSLYAQWSGSPQAWKHPLDVNFPGKVTVEEVLARTAAIHGLRWNVTVEERVREQPLTIDGKSAGTLRHRIRVQFATGAEGASHIIVIDDRQARTQPTASASSPHRKPD